MSTIRVWWTTLITIACLTAHGQFPPAAGQAGSTAIRNDSTAIVAWATGCKVVRGFIDIAMPEGGIVSAGSTENTLGFARGNPVMTLSLGDRGWAILTFSAPIRNGPGPDFVVFENSFSDDFLELAFVEVSSDGESFFRFPSVSLTDTMEQIPTFGTLNPGHIHNLAGKYRAGYGTPFDLSELGNPAGIDINNITHVKVLDVAGSILPQLASRDSEGRIINDPYPTPFPTGGFDLDGIGVIHQAGSGVSDAAGRSNFNIYPNPVRDHFRISGGIHQVTQAWLAAANGSRVRLTPDASGYYSVAGLPEGLYILTLHTSQTVFSTKILIHQ
jgi:hypothetical protein